MKTYKMFTFVENIHSESTAIKSKPNQVDGNSNKRARVLAVSIDPILDKAQVSTKRLLLLRTHISTKSPEANKVAHASLTPQSIQSFTFYSLTSSLKGYVQSKICQLKF